ncbi:transglycosylase SLT domain-containing protein [Denitromonas ohlonensis]|uniref:Lytic transglycosylase domain-containing protein n=2 Tax=Denitromonas TaxID=139331 RepID=A0A558CKR6_9RHOO|nr:transglycosylase SLT domain-containing protein [Denitromonas ohlonensis]TVT49322.1 MAG: lytic transglycosylase domain-containing protein [Denitromonas halophila]TVO62684.1 lytic transglycosylase domain-containing protein [Denitromonas ohlonensis]TVO78888.1 lytic transglycosylase domain-containing protein [Denitromonas ohlonensis]TVT74527.1 MAG: lytic transglycosylase domain-containing protein [Denitromonas halophila]TVT75137.1 MAG: lytic transglycosylase domain-containing protein [Denitromo
MKNATVMKRAICHSGAFLKHFAHGSLIALGLLSAAALVASVIEPQSAARGLPIVSLAQAHAEAVVPVRPTVELADEPEALLQAPPVVATADAELSPELERVRSYVARRYRVSQTALLRPLARAEQSAEELGLDPLLIVAVMAIESSFNPMAESTVGAQGLMQVIPRFHQDKIGPDATPESLFDPVTNVRVGALVIQEGLRRYGSLQSALQYYGGALRDENARYAKKVLSMQARLAEVAAKSDA